MLFTSKYFRLLSLMFILLLASSCTQSEASDLSSIIHDRDNYNVETSPYKDDIKFRLSSNKRLDKNDEPIKIANIYDTTIYVTEISQRKSNSFSDIIVQIELKSEIHPNSGTVLSVNRITDKGRKKTGAITAYDDKGNRPTQAGTGRISETERMHFDTRKRVYTDSNEWTFQLAGLNVLKYEKK